MVAADQGEPDADGDPVGNQQAFTPSVEVAPTARSASRTTTSATTRQSGSLPTDYFVVHCHATAPHARPPNWGNEVRLTDQPFDMLNAPFAGGFFTGDYEGLAATGDFLAFFSQPHGSDPASIFFRRVGP